MNKNGRTNRLLNRLPGGLILAVLFLFTGCPGKMTVQPETFAVTFSAGEHGTLTATVDGETITSVVQKDKTVEFTATPADGYEVEKWIVNGTAVANNTTTAYSHKVTAKVEVKVLFKALPPSVIAVTEVTLNKSELTLEEGKSEKLAATVTPANATNKKVTWSSDKQEIASVDTDGTVTAHKAGEAVITVKSEDGGKTASCTVKVTAKDSPSPKYTVTYDKDGSGDVTVEPALPAGGKVEKGTVLTFTAKPAANCEVDKWTLSTGSFEAGTGTDGNVSAKVTVTADISVKVYFKSAGTVRYTVEHLQQNVDGVDYTLKETEIKYGKPTEQTQAATKTYEGFNVKPITQETIAGDGTTAVKVYYDRKDITLILDLNGGSTSTPLIGGTKLTGRFEAAVTVEEPTKDGNVFKGWSPALPKTFPAADPAGTYTARWENVYTVTFSVDGTGGTLKATVDGEEITSSMQVEQGKTVTFTAVPTDSSYEVDKWTLSTGSFEAGTGADGNSSAKVTVTADISVKVYFKPAGTIRYTVAGVEFTMKNIAAVKDKIVGHIDESDNAPHSVSLTAYRIGETEVTQELWQAVMGGNPSSFKDNPAEGEVQTKRPVETVNWYECTAFCNELTKKTDGMSEGACVYYSDSAFTHIYTKADAQAKREVYFNIGKKGFRLPTEAEWEWAAKGGTDNEWAGTNSESELENYAWYKNNSERKTHEVKKKAANGYGLYDMSGNVWEWCWDWYSNSTPSGGQDPTGAASGNDRIRRGGSWDSHAGDAARVYRGTAGPGNRISELGFRVACRP